jgi:hypothetical protein
MGSMGGKADVNATFPSGVLLHKLASSALTVPFLRF